VIILGVSGKKKMVVSEKEEEEIEKKRTNPFFSSFPSYSSLRKGRSRGRLLTVHRGGKAETGDSRSHQKRFDRGLILSSRFEGGLFWVC